MTKTVVQPTTPLFLFVVALFLVACGSQTESQSATYSDTNTEAAVVEEVVVAAPEQDTLSSTGPSQYQILIPANDIAPGKPRVPLIIYDGEQRVASVQSATISAFDLSGETPEEIWRGNAFNYTDYEVPYWVIYPDLATAGIWGFQAILTAEDGTESTAQFAIEVVADPAAPDIGESVPASENRTTLTVDDVTLLSSAAAPRPELHRYTVEQIRDNGRPAVVAFNTPAFCQTAICSPVLGTIETAYDRYGDEVDFIHLEIYKTFEPLAVADEVGEWNLPSEPWTFVLGSNGKVAARLAGPVSPEELSQILDRELAN